MNKRRRYPAFLLINGVLINEIVIDPHYQVNHSEHMSDELIVLLVKNLNGRTIDLDSTNYDFKYFRLDDVSYVGKTYRLILVMEIEKTYIGVINAFRK
jgi:hypothetical protein